MHLYTKINEYFMYKCIILPLAFPTGMLYIIHDVYHTLIIHMEREAFIYERKGHLSVLRRP